MRKKNKYIEPLLMHNISYLHLLTREENNQVLLFYHNNK